MKRSLWLGMLVLAALVLLAFTGYQEWGLAAAFPRSSHPTGIDISHHQGKVSWGRLERSQVSFAFLKATEGGDWRDATFLTNVEGATAAGIPVGAYHYFTLCRSGAEQAANFLAAIKGAPLSLRPAVDLEYGGNCGVRPSREAFATQLGQYLSALDTAGYAPVLYATERFYADYLDQPRFAAYPLWLRDLFMPLASPTGRHVLIWQFANRARLDGISGPVDRNALMGDLSELASKP